VHIGPPMSKERKKRIEALRELTSRLGGSFEVLEAPSKRQISRTLIGRANELNATQMIVGESKRGWRQPPWRASVVRTILYYGRNMDVLVVANFEPGAHVAKGRG